MAVSLESMVSRLENQVPARNGVPADYEQVVQDAVLQLSQDVPRVAVGTLSVVAGTATYDLPSDFLFLIQLESLSNPDGIIISDAGIIPIPVHWEEQYYVDGAEITFDPTPTYTLTRQYRYAALYELDSNDVYQKLTTNGARVALLYAQYLALTEQANAVAGDGWRYRIGDEEVDKSKQGDGLGKRAQGLLDAYQREVKAQKGYGSRARYNVLGE